jgi:hypothetical protein
MGLLRYIPLPIETNELSLSLLAMVDNSRAAVVEIKCQQLLKGFGDHVFHIRKQRPDIV